MKLALLLASFSRRLRPEARDAMNLELDLTRHCIETELKRRNNAAISRYFKAGDEKSDMEEELSLLEQAIRAFDFQLLRSRWPALSGGAGIQAVLVQDEAGKPMLSLENRFIVPPANLL